MMQGGPQAPQPGGGAPRAAAPTMYRPEHMRNILYLSDDEKKKYEEGLRQLWTIFENNPEGSSDREAARKKIQDFANVLMKKVRERRTQGAQPQPVPAAGADGMATQSGGAAGTGPGGRPNPTVAPSTPAGNTTGPAGAPAPGPQQSGQAGPKWSESIQKHMNSMSFRPPANLAPDAAEQWIEGARRKYGGSLGAMEASRNNMQKLDAMIKQRQESGNPLSAEETKVYNDRKTSLQKHFEEAQKFVFAMRKQQGELLKQQEGVSQGQAKASAVNAGPTQRPQPMPQQANQMKGPGQPTTLQNSTANINGAIAAAKKEQAAAAGRMTGGNGLPANLQQAQPASQTPSVTRAPQAPAPVKVEPGAQPTAHQHPPPVNTALAAASKASVVSAGTPTQNSARLQTPQSATPIGGLGPQAFTHEKAMEEANKRTTSVSGAIPTQSGIPTAATGASSSGSAGVIGSTTHQGHLHAHPNQQTPQTLQNKMPIPKQLPEKATLAAQGVSLGGGISAGRPTMTGGGGTAGGVMGQPAVAKVPMISLESEGERMISKKKLDELVRQVCGGQADGQDGNLLSPEVEESVLDMADSFIDNVLHQACRNAKERGSKILEIRDIQLVLERVYNMRIPGFSSDELRTVRRVQPSASWIHKMSAVQAAKVMPGKGDQ